MYRLASEPNTKNLVTMVSSAWKNKQQSLIGDCMTTHAKTAAAITAIKSNTTTTTTTV